jgi:hypothetical protein
MKIKSPKAGESMERTNITEYTMDLDRVHLYVFIMIIPVLLIYLIPFILIWDVNVLRSGWEPFYIKLLPVLIPGVVIHELLHGIGWSFFVPGGMKAVSFGIHWKYLAPYCHCKVPMKAKYYRIGSALPLLVLGILPAIIAVISGSGTLLLFGVLFTWTAGGDIISLFLMRKLEGNSLIHDHPHKMGFYTKG